MTWSRLHEQDRYDVRYPSEGVVRFLKGQPGRSERVLDVGCGTGRHTRLAFELGYRSIVACDVSVPGLKRAYTKLPLPIYAQADMWRLPYRTASVGILLAVHSLYYTDQQGMEMALRECHRVLRPGGVAYIALRSDADWRAQLPGDTVGFSSRTLRSNDSGEEGLTVTYLSNGALRLLFRPWRTVDIGHETIVENGHQQDYWNVRVVA